MSPVERYARLARAMGCPLDQVANFLAAELVLQERQLRASAAARLCDLPDGPTAIGYGGARGGGKSHWLLAQMGGDDCQRMPGLKCLLLRKVGKANLENFEDLRKRLFMRLPHDFSAYRKTLRFRNGSLIIAGHFQHEKDIDDYLGLEYDVIGIEEATTLSHRKHQDISTCCRTSKPGWRPRIYSTTNPGGVGHGWYKAKFIMPHQRREEKETRFIPAKVGDNRFNNPEYMKVLEALDLKQEVDRLHSLLPLKEGRAILLMLVSDMCRAIVDVAYFVALLNGTCDRFELRFVTFHSTSAAPPSATSSPPNT